MKQIYLIVMALMLVGGPSFAQNKMVGLGDYMAQNSKLNKASMLYVVSRCAAYFSLVATLAPNKNVEGIFLNKAQRLANGATVILKDIKGGAIKDLSANSLKTITAMTKAYIAEANQNYTLRGNYIKGSQLLESDADICAEISKSF
tara:strand:- start:513 stop:950 length:438 start_codon:yes stop_codon:yes gene_type:complete